MKYKGSIVNMLQRVCCIAVCAVLCVHGACGTTLKDIYNETWTSRYTEFKQQALGERDTFLRAATSCSRCSQATFAVGIGFALGSAGACLKKPFFGYSLIAPAFVSLCCLVASLVYKIKSLSATKKKEEWQEQALNHARTLVVCQVNKETPNVEFLVPAGSDVLSFVRGNLEADKRTLNDGEHNRLKSIIILQKTLANNGGHTKEVDDVLSQIKVDPKNLALSLPGKQ